MNNTKKEIENLKTEMEKNKMNKEELKKNSELIELTLVAFGISARIAKVNDYKDCTQYCLELALGTPIQDLLKLDKDIALTLSSPTGNIEIQAPIPNSSLIGITVPKHKKYDKKIPGVLLHSYAMDFERIFFKPTDRWRGKTSNFIYILGSLLIRLSNKIDRKQNPFY